MGTWHGPTVEESLYRILEEFDPDYTMLRSRLELIEKLVGSGHVVRADFYVPDMGELWGLKRSFSYYLAQGMEGVRWVMCRETVQALVKKYQHARFAPAQGAEVELWVDDAAARAVSTPLGLAVVTVAQSPESAQYTLFGVPVRIDPAARSPLFEIDTPATRRIPVNPSI